MKKTFDSETNYYDPGTGDYLIVDGQIVERDALSIAERINDYDENLVLLCLADNSSFSEVHEAPFVLCERRPDGSLHRVFEAWKLDETILERIFNADGRRFDPLNKIETLEQQQKRQSEGRYREKMSENLDILVSAVKNQKSTYTVENSDGELVRIHEDKPPTRVASETTITHGR